TEEG
ncbi:hypothetical protein D043_4556B, partial [Vibrio parahaemolyticus EKP-021]